MMGWDDESPPMPWETEGDLPWVSDVVEWEAPDPDAWRGTVHQSDWPEELAGPEYWMYKRAEQSDGEDGA